MDIRKTIVCVMSAGMIMTCISAAVFADNTPGWSGSDSEGWRYYTSGSTYVASDWLEVGGKWYYFNSDGYAITDDWLFIDGSLYHFSKSGAMDTNKWIDCGPYGYEDKIELKDTPQYKEYANKRLWRYVGNNGKAYTGWKQVGGKWYYFDFESEKYDTQTGNYYYSSDYEDIDKFALMHYGWLYDRNKGDYYCFDGNGLYYHDNWLEWHESSERSYTYYFGSDGTRVRGWKQIDGKWHYFRPEHITDMIRGFEMEDKDGNSYMEIYAFNEKGEMQTGWIQDKNTKFWYYARSNGKCISNDWLQLNGKWYFFNDYGWMLAGIDNVLIDGKYYSFDSSGACKNPNSGVAKPTGWLKVWEYTHYDSEYNIYHEYSWHYFDDNGKMCKGWKQIDGKWYFFNEENGDMLQAFKNQKYRVSFFDDGNRYAFNRNGEMVTGWINYDTVYFETSDNDWCYAGKNGAFYRNKWLYTGGVWYYFDDNNMMLHDTYNEYINGRYYDFDSTGACIDPNGKDEWEP